MDFFYVAKILEVRRILNMLIVETASRSACRQIRSPEIKPELFNKKISHHAHIFVFQIVAVVHIPAFKIVKRL